MARPEFGSLGDTGPGSTGLISVDTSVIVRYLVGTPTAQARRAAALIDDVDTAIGISVVALAESAHVLRTQYAVAATDICDVLIDLVQRENITLLDQPAATVIEMLVRARSMPGRPIPDALIAASAKSAGALPLVTFDRGQARYGLAVREP